MTAQRWWWSTRAAVAVAALVGTWTLSARPIGALPGWLARWDRWDAQLFTKVAHWGYAGYPVHYPDRGVVAFFPGLPLVERALHGVGLDYRAAGLLVSLVAGAVAASALARLGAQDGGARVGELAVGALVLSPYAVFLAAGYSEALFLALALPAWLAARRGDWRMAGLLAAAASLVRVTGAFLAVALVVEHLAVRRGRVRRDAAWLALPFAALAGYAAYLRHLTGDWLAWPHAQRDQWGRRLVDPLSALRTTWSAARSTATNAEYAWSFRTEIVAVVVGVALTAWLLARRRWGESAYVGTQVAALATSAFYLSVARAALLWWPLWLLAGRAGARWPAARVGYAAVCAPLMAVFVVVFTQGRWVG